MDFKIGQKFLKEEGYPPEAAEWCNARGGCYIEATSEGFIIKMTPEESTEEASKRVRLKRDALLRETDFYMLPDYPSDQASIEAVKLYRKSLRDIPEQAGFPRDIVWPDVPKVLCKTEAKHIGLAELCIK